MFKLGIVVLCKTFDTLRTVVLDGVSMDTPIVLGTLGVRKVVRASSAGVLPGLLQIWVSSIISGRPRDYRFNDGGLCGGAVGARHGLLGEPRGFSRYGRLYRGGFLAGSWGVHWLLIGAFENRKAGGELVPVRVPRFRFGGVRVGLAGDVVVPHVGVHDRDEGVDGATGAAEVVHINGPSHGPPVALTLDEVHLDL